MNARTVSVRADVDEAGEVRDDVDSQILNPKAVDIIILQSINLHFLLKNHHFLLKYLHFYINETHRTPGAVVFLAPIMVGGLVLALRKPKYMAVLSMPAPRKITL